jgi:chemotaxis response regulator CheB
MPKRNPNLAAKPADKVMAIKEIGAASIILRFRKNTNSGKESIAPPAPVMARTKPTNRPSKRLIWIGSSTNRPQKIKALYRHQA